MITDRALLASIQRLMIEPTVDDGLTWASGLWTLQEVLGYANQRQQRFIAETCLVGGWYEQAAPATELQQLDDELVFLKHALFEVDGVCQPLLPLSTFSSNMARPGWRGQNQPHPMGYIVGDRDTTKLSLVPPPTAAGTLHLFAVVLAEVLDRSGVLLNIPNEWTPYLRYGIMADMLGKQGDAFDAARAEYCEQRYMEGVESARAVLEAII